MQRRILLARLALAATWTLLLSTTACGGDIADGPEVWRVALEEPLGSVQDAYAQEFKRRIERATDGAVEVRIYPYGALGTSADVTEQLRMGALQFAMASPGHLGTMIPEVQVFLLHFLFSDDDGVNRRALADPALFRFFAPLFGAKGMALLSVFPEGWMAWTVDREVRAPQDFAGVKIRTMTSPLLLEAYRAYGAGPQAMPYAEVYSALQLNMIDAQVNPIFAIEEMSFYEVTSHLVMARHAPFIATFTADAEFLAAQTSARRVLIEDTVAALHPWIFEVQARYNEERLERILERKPELVVLELEEQERALFRALSLPVREIYTATCGPRAAAALEAVLDAVATAAAQD